MRLATYESHGSRRLGALVDDVVIDLPSAVADPAFPHTMEGLLRAGPTTIETARGTLAGNRVKQYAVESARLLVPILPASLRDFLAFESHIAAGSARRGEPVPEAWYEIPIYYKGNHRSVFGPEEEIPWPPYTNELDYELEVACVLGGRGRDLDEDAAGALIFGYTLLNDWSARDIQRQEMAGRLGPAKAKDFATSLGPCIVTADELDPRDVDLVARVDGEVWSEGSLSEARWTFPQMIAHVSQGEDVWPGDVYGSGTFGGGCGLDLGKLLWPGALVELEAEGIGVLRNRVGPKP